MEDTGKWKLCGAGNYSSLYQDAVAWFAIQKQLGEDTGFEGYCVVAPADSIEDIDYIIENIVGL